MFVFNVKPGKEIFTMKAGELDELKFDEQVNRSINKTHLTKLTNIIQKSKTIVTIIVDEDMFVLDGQHRVSVAKKLGLDIDYQIYYNVPVAIDERMAFIAFLQKAKQWAPKDFIEKNNRLRQMQDVLDTYDSFNKDCAMIYLYNGTGFKSDGITDATVSVPVISQSHLDKLPNVYRDMKFVINNIFGLKSSRSKTAFIESVVKEIGVDKYLLGSEDFKKSLAKNGLFVKGHTLADIDQNSLKEIRESVSEHFYDICGGRPEDKKAVVA